MDGCNRDGYPFWDGGVHAGDYDGLSLGGVQMTTRKTKNGLFTLPVFRDVREFREYSDGDGGWCVNCADFFPADPDTRRGECELCEKRTIWGLEELAVDGFIRFEGGAE